VSLELKELRGCSSICCSGSFPSCFSRFFFFEDGDSDFCENRDGKRTCLLPAMADVRVDVTVMAAKRYDARVKVESGCSEVVSREPSARVRSWEPEGKVR
jgi:hypothetical protein